MTTGRINQVTISIGRGTDPPGQAPEEGARVYYWWWWHPRDREE